MVVSMVSRRAFLRHAGRVGTGALLAAGVGGGATGWWTTSRSAALTGNDEVDGLLPSPPVVPFDAVFRTPPVLAPTRVEADADYYEMTMRPAVVEILPGRSTTIWGFNGQFPGPTIKARRGRRVVIRQTNQLPEAKPAVHLHGGHVEARFDGYPTDVIPLGASRDYVYPNRQIAASLSYHDHEMHRTGPNVYMGLVGAYLLEDDEEAALNLPSGDYDVPLIIQDRAFGVDGSLRYSPGMDGMFGDVILVNGVAQPRFGVANRKYRLRIYNASNARAYELTLSSGQPFVQIATDGGLLPSPVQRTSIPLQPFERVEVVVDFSSVEVGSPVILQNGLAVGRTAAIMRFDVERQEEDRSSVPSVLRPVERLEEKAATVSFHPASPGGGGAPLRSRIWNMSRWMCMGWGWGPDRFVNCQISVSPRRGVASTRAWSKGWSLMTQVILSPPMAMPSVKSLVTVAAFSSKRSKGRRTEGTLDWSSSRRSTSKRMIAPVRPPASPF